MVNIDLWTLFGFFAQFIFFLRFVVQWYASEKQKKSVIPMSFWYLSIVGSILICAYSIVRHDIVFITSTILSLVIYSRNIVLRKKEKEMPAP
jgi:lipid-A-disaccharide synthase-like uncharacterized protein